MGTKIKEIEGLESILQDIGTPNDGSVTNAKLAADVESRISDLETEVPNKADAISEAPHVETNGEIDVSTKDQISIALTANRTFGFIGFTEANPIKDIAIDHGGFTPTFTGATLVGSLVDINGSYYLKAHRHADGVITLVSLGASGSEYDVTNAELNAMKSKLDLIEAEAKDDQTAIEIVALLDAYLGTGWREANGDFLPTANPVSISSENQVGQSIDLTYTYYDEDGDLEDTTDTASGSEYDIRRYADASAANADSDKTGGTSVGTGRTQGSPVNDVYTLQAGDVDSVIMAWVKVKNANGESAWTKSNVSSVVIASGPIQTVTLSLGSTTGPPTNVNVHSNGSQDGATANLLNSSGANTGFSYYNDQAPYGYTWAGNNPGGAGVVGDVLYDNALYISGAGSRKQSFRNLDLTKKYKVKVVCYHDTDNSTTGVTITHASGATERKTISHMDNLAFLEFDNGGAGYTPQDVSSNGHIGITIDYGATGNGWINAIVLEEYN